jgi:cyclohexyl-isocyanide hydratase
MIQLRMEYNPAPPFGSGSPDTAPPEVIARLRQRNPSGQEYRKAANARAANRLGLKL